jgi:HAMP domain-containing protein
MVSLPLAYLTNRNQEEILANGLQQRTEVLLESLASGGRAYLPTRNLLELGNLPGQMTAMGQDALFVTVTGEAASDSPQDSGTEWVWATNDPELLKEGRLRPGTLKVEDRVTPRVNELAQTLNQEAAARVNEISQEILLLNQQVEPLVTEFIRTQNPETEEAINQIQEQLRLLDTTLTARLLEIGNVVFSVPPYDPGSLSRENTEYVFFKPVLFRREGQDRYYRGTVRLGVSTESILQDIQASQRQLFLIIGVVAVIALFLGILGALALATIIIRPIRILVRGVEVIRDADDIAKELEGHVIDTRTRDELSELATTVNQMTTRLVDAAKASEMLTMGKDVQKRWISLDKITGSKDKGTVARLENDDVAVFGYYEGALGVSGDLFDFHMIDDRHLAFIKGDISGKGVPAALFMVQVSTLYTAFFRTWKARNDERLAAGQKPLALPDVSVLVDQTNDLLDAVGAAEAGRFAAFITGIMDVKTGRVELCHAGDNLLHLFDNEKGMYTRELPGRPTAGSFSSEMVKMQMGYSRDIQVLKRGDALILYTDGLEEAQRHFRDGDFQIRKCGEPAPPDVPEDKKDGWFHGDDQHGKHPPKENFEELGNIRIHTIIDAVFRKGGYSLYKYHNPVADEKLTFDFSQSAANVEDAITALLGVERIFRFYPDPSSGPEDIIRIDKRIDEFLKKHFDQYDNYFHHPLAKPRGVSSEEMAVYNYYSHIREDHQFDDLTVLGIMKK